MNIFLDIGFIIILATVGGFIARFLKQPLISFYILAGILIGPVLGLIQDIAVVDVLSEIGIAFLLFIVGIEVDLKRLKQVGSIASFGGFLQMGISFLLGFGAFILLGFTSMESAYAGILLLFSSTMVIVKILADKSQLDTLHGRIILGTLLVQDIVAVILLSVMSNIAEFSILTLLWSIFQGMLVFVFALFFSKVLFPQLFKFAAKSQELFFLLSLSVCFSFALIFASIGFSIAIGAFVAGLMLGNLPYNVEIISKVRGLRDFFSTLFFVSMGIKLTFDALSSYTVPFLVLVLLSAFIAPLITFLATRSFGFNKKTSFLTAIAMTQVSEFALIAVDQGVKLGHIGEDFLSLTILVTLITIMITSYLLKYEHGFYKFSLPFLKLFDKFFKKQKKFSHSHKDGKHDSLLIGYDRIGYNIFKTLRKLKHKVLIVDYNPDIIEGLISQKIPCLYGDIGDFEVLEQLHLKDVKLVVSTIPDHQDTLLLLKEIRKHNKDARVVVTSYVVEEALNFYNSGADYVILPHLLGGKHAGFLLEEVSTDIDKLISTKLAHIDELKNHAQKLKKGSKIR